MLTVSFRFGDESPLISVRGAFQTVTSPVRYLGSTIASPFKGIANVVTNLTTDQATLSELQDQIDELQARNVELEEAEQTAVRLQELLDLQDTYSLQSTAANVISSSTDSWTSTITIDKGSTSGLEVGMPVTSATGVIGQIIEVSATTSTVRLLTDESSSVSAMIQSTRSQGMLVGSATGEVTLTLISTSEDVEVGDTVVTSGLGGVFPKGLAIGTVTSVESSSGSLYLDITVELFASSGSYEEVLVITSLTEEQSADSDDIADADEQEKSTGDASTTTTDESTDDSTEDGESSDDQSEEDTESESTEETTSGE